MCYSFIILKGGVLEMKNEKIGLVFEIGGELVFLAAGLAFFLSLFGMEGSEASQILSLVRILICLVIGGFFCLLGRMGRLLKD